MSISVKVDPFNTFGYLADLERAMPGQLRAIIRGEAGSILKACVLDTKVAKPPQIDARARSEANRLVRVRLYRTKRVERGQFYSNVGRFSGPKTAGRLWWRVPSKAGSAKFLIIRQTGGADIWGNGRPKTGRMQGKNGIGSSVSRRQIPSQAVIQKSREFVGLIKAQQPASKQAGRGAAGLARQSWVQIADDAGIRLETVQGGRSATAAVAKARRAIASDGRVHMNGTAEEIGRGFAQALVLRNHYPLAERIHMDRTLHTAVAGRLGYFLQNARRGVLTDAAKLAKKYPNIQVNLT